VRAYIGLAAKGRRGEVDNVCTGHAVVIRDLDEALVGRARVPVAIVQDPARYRPVDVPVVVGSPARLSAVTGCAPALPRARTPGATAEGWRRQTGDSARHAGGGRRAPSRAAASQSALSGRGPPRLPFTVSRVPVPPSCGTIGETKANRGSASALPAGISPADHPGRRRRGARRRHGGPDGRPPPIRPRAIPGGALPIGAEPGREHALQVDPQSLSGVPPRLPLLFRAPLPRAVRDGSRRRVRLGDSGEGQSAGRARPRADEAFVDARAG